MNCVGCGARQWCPLIDGAVKSLPLIAGVVTRVPLSDDVHWMASLPHMGADARSAHGDDWCLSLPQLLWSFWSRYWAEAPDISIMMLIEVLHPFRKYRMFSIL